MAVTEPAPAAPLLSGSLADFPVDEVLRFVDAGGRSGTVTVTGALPVELVVGDGLVGAAGAAGGSRAGLVEVLFHLRLVGNGDFSFDPAGVAVDGERWAVGEVLDEVADRAARWRRISKVLPSLDVVVRLCPATDDEPVTLAASGWNVAAAVDGTRSVRDVTLRVGGDAFATMEAVHDLILRGLAEVVPPPDGP